MCRRIVLVGDSGCGKTALAMKISENIYTEEFYQPTNFEHYQTEVGNCQIKIMDTSGCPSNAELRELAYKDCDAVIVCFDLTDETTLESVEKSWIPEVKLYCPQTPIYIVGCKRDAMCERECSCDYETTCCMQSEEELMEIVSSTGAVAYLECSAAEKCEDGVEEIFQFVVETSGKKKKSIFASIKKRTQKLKKRLSIH